MIHDGDVCGATPVTLYSISATYCHAHGAWVLTGTGYTQDGDEPTVHWAPAPIELGPFDGRREMLHHLEVLARRLIARATLQHASTHTGA